MQIMPFRMNPWAYHPFVKGVMSVFAGQKMFSIMALKEFSAKKEAFYKVINDFQLLDEKEKAKMISYLDSFYDDFDKRNSIVTNILNGCTNF